MIPKSISKPGASLSPVCVDTAGVHVRLMAALLAQLSEYLALTKPRVMSLVVFTAMVGLVASPGHVEPAVGLATILCIALGAGAAGTLNMWYDADVDAVMSRTAARPIPRGRISARSALAFGMPSGALSVVVLETWLVVTGVILSGAFPVVYATLVSAFYVPVIIMLLGLILRGVSFEFRNQHPGTRWIWDSCFILGSLAVSFMQGVMVGLLLEDLKFIDGKYSGGLFGSFNDFSVLCGVSYTTTTIGLSKWSR